jgi:hypothetical protein
VQCTSRLSPYVKVYRDKAHLESRHHVDNSKPLVYYSIEQIHLRSNPLTCNESSVYRVFYQWCVIYSVDPRHVFLYCEMRKISYLIYYMKRKM